MKKTTLLALLLFAIAAHSQLQMRVAVMATVDDADSLQYMDTDFLTGKLREIASNVLPKDRYAIMTQESIVAYLGSQERAEKECREASCLAELGRKINADYVSQGRIGRFSGMLVLKVELYKSGNGNLVSTFSETANDLLTLATLIDNKAPNLFREILKENKAIFPAPPPVAGGISGLKTADGYEIDGSHYFLANINTEPQGAALSFDGVPNEKCPKTPCKVELAEGEVRIFAALEQYERADTTVSIAKNEQNVAIRLKANFGVLEIKPAYFDGMNRDKRWSLTINDKPYSLGEIRFSPGSYAVKLNHECYEDISFTAGITKDKREVFDIAKHMTLKQGGLVLRAEQDGKPVSEPVFVNGKRDGETPFTGSVPLCAIIEMGEKREKVEVSLKHKEDVEYTHKIWVSESERLEEQERKQREEDIRNKVRKFSFSLGFSGSGDRKKMGKKMGRFSMNSIDNFYDGSGSLSLNGEFFRADVDFIRIGLNMDLGYILADRDAIEKMHPDDAVSGEGFTGLLKIGAFARLYPLNSWYLSGGVGLGYYGAYDLKMESGNNILGSRTFAPVFSVGTGLVHSGVFFMELQYNVLPFIKNRDAQYLSFSFGVKTRP